MKVNNVQDVTNDEVMRILGRFKERLLAEEVL